MLRLRGYLNLYEVYADLYSLFYDEINMQSLKNREKVTIIGAGWLGLPLARALTQECFSVIATKRDPQAVQELQNQYGTATLNFEAFDASTVHKHSSETIPNGDAQYRKLFLDRHIIITIPPSAYPGKAASDSSHSYPQAIQSIVAKAVEFGAKTIFFTSSISVYGKSSGLINEELPPMPLSSNAKAIVEVEKLLLTQKSLSTIILRLGGLIGNGRHPIYALSGKKAIAEPNNAINLIHITDVIAAIIALLKRPKTLQHQVFNIVTPVNPNRKAYYEAVAQHLSLPQPHFSTEQSSLKRVIDGNRITEKGDFFYQVLDLIKAPC